MRGILRPSWKDKSIKPDRLLIPICETLRAQFAAQFDDAFHWAPVFLGLGIWCYFARKTEPGQSEIYLALLCCGALFGVARLLPMLARFTALAIAICAGGYGLAGLRSYQVAEPVLSFRYYGPIEGRIVVLDRSQSDVLRLTLDRVVLAEIEPRNIPARVRVSLHGEQGFIVPAPGQTVILTGHLSPPGGPVEPGGFDFQRLAWFQRIGAVGYTRSPVLLGRPEAEGGGLALRLYRLRMAISDRVRNVLDGPTGGFAAAILTGDRSAIAEAEISALRASNLAHLLAISGMHMGLLTGFIFGAARLLMACIRPWALRYPCKKIAAAIALVGAVIYLMISGGAISTQRAFIMVAVMLGAILADRHALSLRTVALAALIVLGLRPEELFGPGFQMSFAATTALVVVFSCSRLVNLKLPLGLQPLGAVFISSLVAGLATAPFGAYHFNQIAQYGLIANVLSVPVMGVLVMPAAVGAALLAPFGLEVIGLWAMDLGLRWILTIAHLVANMGEAVRHVAHPGAAVLAALIFGGMWLLLWHGRGRWIGVFAVMGALFEWQNAERPAILIADTGGLVGVMGPEGRMLSKERGESFAALNWLENDGDAASQSTAFQRFGLSMQSKEFRVELSGINILSVRGATAIGQITGCGGADILITNQIIGPRPGCEVFDLERLRNSGAVAGWWRDGAIEFVTATETAGERLWNSVALRAALQRQ